RSAPRRPISTSAHPSSPASTASSPRGCGLFPADFSGGCPRYRAGRTRRCFVAPRRTQWQFAATSGSKGGCMKLTDFKALTFDCYGTLIDWESGMVEALRPLTSKVGTELTRDQILEAHARHESSQQLQTPAKRYSE